MSRRIPDAVRLPCYGREVPVSAGIGDFTGAHAALWRNVLIVVVVTLIASSTALSGRLEADTGVTPHPSVEAYAHDKGVSKSVAAERLAFQSEVAALVHHYFRKSPELTSHSAMDLAERSATLAITSSEVPDDMRRRAAEIEGDVTIERNAELTFRQAGARAAKVNTAVNNEGYHHLTTPKPIHVQARPRS